MAANYYCILMDLDGTLFDFAESEKLAILATINHFDLKVSEELDAVSLFKEINENCWLEHEQKKLRREKIGFNRFTLFLQALDLQGRATEMNLFFENHLADNPVTFLGAKELLEELAEFSTLAAISNGFARTQMSRLEQSGLLPYFDDVFISEKLNIEKPDPRFFNQVVKELGIATKSKVLVVGDSLTADIAGAIKSGLDSCWCNFNGDKNNTKITPTHTITTYAQLKLCAIGKEELARAELREKRHTV